MNPLFSKGGCTACTVAACNMGELVVDDFPSYCEFSHSLHHYSSYSSPLLVLFNSCCLSRNESTICLQAKETGVNKFQPVFCRTAGIVVTVLKDNINCHSCPWKRYYLIWNSFEPLGLKHWINKYFTQVNHYEIAWLWGGIENFLMKNQSSCGRRYWASQFERL